MFSGGNTPGHKWSPNFSGQLSPFEGNHCGRKAEASENFTSNINVGLELLENWLGPIELNAKKSSVSL